MKTPIYGLLAFVIGCVACTKNNTTPINTTKEPQYAISFSLTGFRQDTSSYVTAARVGADTINSTNMSSLAWMIFNSKTGEQVKMQTFGIFPYSDTVPSQVKDSLPAGTYMFVFGATADGYITPNGIWDMDPINLPFPYWRYDRAEFTFLQNKYLPVRDFFFTKKIYTVTKDTTFGEVVLDRQVAKIEINLLDARPDGHVRAYLQHESEAFLIQRAAPKMITSESPSGDFFEVSPGKLTKYVLTDNKYPYELHIENLDTTGQVTHQRIIKDLTCNVGDHLILTGNLYTIGTTFNVFINKTWGDSLVTQF